MLLFYKCPYDLVSTAKRSYRRCAVHRYIPVIPNARNSRWDEAELTDGTCVVKVDGPLEVHQQLQADADFQLITRSAAIALNYRGKTFDHIDKKVAG